MATDEKRPDLHHSQPVRVSEILDALTPAERAALEKRTADERAGEEQRAGDKRVQEGTRDGWMQRLTIAIEKRLAEQNELTRNLTFTLDSFRANAVEQRTLSTLREIRADVQEMKDNSRINEGVLTTLCEIRDINREIRDFMADSVQHGQQMQDLMLADVRSIKDAIDAIAAVAVRLGSNGHSPEGEPT